MYVCVCVWVCVLLEQTHRHTLEYPYIRVGALSLVCIWREKNTHTNVTTFDSRYYSKSMSLKCTKHIWRFFYISTDRQTYSWVSFVSNWENKMQQKTNDTFSPPPPPLPTTPSTHTAVAQSFILFRFSWLTSSLLVWAHFVKCEINKWRFVR